MSPRTSCLFATKKMGFGSQLVAQKLTSLAEELSPWVRFSTHALTTLCWSSVSVALLASNSAVTVPTHSFLRPFWGAVCRCAWSREMVCGTTCSGTTHCMFHAYICVADGAPISFTCHSIRLQGLRCRKRRQDVRATETSGRTGSWLPHNYASCFSGPIKLHLRLASAAASRELCQNDATEDLIKISVHLKFWWMCHWLFMPYKQGEHWAWFKPRCDAIMTTHGISLPKSVHNLWLQQAPHNYDVIQMFMTRSPNIGGCVVFAHCCNYQPIAGPSAPIFERDGACGSTTCNSHLWVFDIMCTIIFAHAGVHMLAYSVNSRCPFSFSRWSGSHP